MKIRKLVAAFLFVSSPAVADEITISDFNWYGNDSYCSFQLPDQAFAFDNPETWRYVFITNLPVVDFDNLPETPEEIAAAELSSYKTAFMMIDHGFHELTMTSGSAAENGALSITYTTHDDKPYEVVLEAKGGEAGYESQDYTGSVTVHRDGVSASVEFKGDCGV